MTEVSATDLGRDSLDTTTSAVAQTLAIPGPSLADFVAARERVSTVARSTPMESSRFLSDLIGSPVFLKCESLQRTGSYKLRGAYNRMSQLSEEERAKGVVAASAGNHAQGVAFAARELGIKSTIFMPVGVALPKLQATRSYGADVVLRGHTVEEPLRAAAQFAEKTGAIFIPPFDHPDVVAGQGTLGLEILEQVPEIDTIVIPIGGGGLISGVASALKQALALQGRSLKVIGVQAENAAPYVESLRTGVATPFVTSPTIADGIAVAMPGVLNFEIIKHVVDEVVVVSDDDIARALLMLLERAKLVVEPAGAASIAAMLTGKVTGGKATVAILSGGNIDPQMMERVISRGLAASDRYLKLRLMLPDRPGQLARVAELISEANANVIEVLHTRHGRKALITEVELEMSIETRGPEHVQRVLEMLREAGYEPRVDF